MCWMILNFVQEMGVRTDLERGWSTQQNLFLSFLICEAKTGPTCKLFPIFFCATRIFSYKICLGTRTVCIRWMDLELCTGDGCKNWPRKGLVHPAKSLPEFLDLLSKDWSYMQISFLFWKRNFVICLLRFAYMKFESVKFVLRVIFTRKFWWKRFRNRDCLHVLNDLELCTGDGCKNWPRKGLVHPAKSLPEFLDLWSKDWSYV